MSDEIKDMLQAIQKELKEIRSTMATKEDLHRLETKLDTVTDQTANLTEFRTEVKSRLSRVEANVSEVNASLNYVIQDVYLLKKKQG